MHQIKVNVIRPQASELLLKEFLDGGCIFEKIIGEFVCNIDLIPAVIPFQDCAESFLAAAVYVSGVKVVNAVFYGQHNFFLSLFKIDLCARAGKAHAAVAENRHFCTVFHFSVLHNISVPKHKRCRRDYRCSRSAFLMIITSSSYYIVNLCGKSNMMRLAAVTEFTKILIKS